MNRKRATVLALLIALLTTIGFRAQAAPAPHVATHPQQAVAASGEKECFGRSVYLYTWDTSRDWSYGRGDWCIADGAGRRLVWQRDGNLVMYDNLWTNRDVLWSADTNGFGWRLTLRHNGNVDIFNEAGNVVYAADAYHGQMHPTYSKVFQTRIEILVENKQAPHCTGHFWVTENWFRYAHPTPVTEFQYPSVITDGDNQWNFYCAFTMQR